MKKITVIHLVFLLNLFFSTNIVIAMEPDAKALSDPEFVAKFDCLTDHFQIERYFEKEEWIKAMKIIEGLEHKGYADRALSIAKGKIFFKVKEYDKAIFSFKKSLDQKYKCYWTSYRLSYPPLKDMADQGIVWHYIYQVYMAMEMLNQANAAYNTSIDFLMKSLDIPVMNNIKINENDMATIEKIFLLYDLNRKPLWPFNPWSQYH